MNSLAEGTTRNACHYVSSSLFDELHKLDRPTPLCFASPVDYGVPHQLRDILKKHFPSSDGSFPGPMCCPFRKHNVDYVKATPYTVMEKSDGLRVLVVGHSAKAFPVWRTDESMLLTDSVSVTLKLETCYQELKACETASLSVDGDSLSLSKGSSSDEFILSSSSSSRSITRNCEPQLLLYGIDRAMDSGFLFDTFFSADLVDFFIADTELVESYESQSILAFFDLYAISGVNESFNLSCTENTMHRYSVLSQLLTRSLVRVPSCYSSPLHVLLKTIYRLDQLTELLAKIGYNEESKQHFYKGNQYVTPNDGIIFTPELFPCYTSGSRWDQLKWKWRDSLTVDWKVYSSGQPTLYHVALYLKKNGISAHDTVEGHWKLFKPICLDNPYNFSLPSIEKEAVVAECSFNWELGLWSIQRIRKDKKGANFIGTALSVIESIAEDCSLEYIIDHLQLRSDSVVDAKRLQATAVLPPQPVFKEQRKFCPLSLRAKAEGGKHSFYLTWCTNKTNSSYTKTIHIPLCRVSDCYAKGFDKPAAQPNTMLYNLLMIELANNGGSYAWSDFVVDAAFDRIAGRWAILRFRKDGKNGSCYFDNVFTHLCYVACSDPLVPQTDLPLKIPTIALSSTELTNTHYGNKVSELGNESNRSALREFNNLIKAYQVQWSCTIVGNALGADKPRVIDLCCGRGGDLLKWSHNSVSFLYMTDASTECVAEAAARYSTNKAMSLRSVKPGFPAKFAVHDAFDYHSRDLYHDIVDATRKSSFHIASCQFSIHYGCQTENHCRYFISCVSAALITGGIFIGTTVCDSTLLEIFKKYGQHFQSTSISVHFSLEASQLLSNCDSIVDFGIKYSTSVENCVSDLSEYIVPWGTFCDLCKEYSLELVDSSTFDIIANENTDELSDLLGNGFQLAKKRGLAGLLKAMPNDEASRLYRAFSFRKV